MGGGEYTTGPQRVSECYVKLSSSWMSREELLTLISNTLGPLRISLTVLDKGAEREESAQYQAIDPVTPKQAKQVQTSAPPSAYFTPAQWSEVERPGLSQAESPVPQARLFSKCEPPTPQPAPADTNFEDFGAPGSIPETADEANKQIGRQVKMTPRRLVRQSLGGQFEASPTCVAGKGLAYNLRMPTRVRSKVVTATTVGVDLEAVLGSGVGRQLHALVRGHLTRLAYHSRRASDLKTTIRDSLSFIGDRSPTSALEKQVQSQLQTARADFHQLMVSGPVAERMRAIDLTREYNRKYAKPGTRRRLSMGPAQKTADADTTSRSLRSSASEGSRAPFKDVKNSQPQTTAAKSKRPSMQAPSRQAKGSVPPAIIE